MAVEEGAAEHLLRIGALPGIEQLGDGGVAFTIEGREEIDEHGQHAAAKGEFGIHVAQPAEHLLEGVHHPCEVERHQAAEDAQQDGRRHALDGEGVNQRERKHGLRTGQGVGQAGGRQARHQQGQQRGHRQVDHEHFEGEHQSGDRGLEDAGHGTRGAAADEQHERLVVQAAYRPQMRADG